MRLAKTNRQERTALMKLCNELNQLEKERSGIWHAEPFSRKNYPVLARLGNPDKNLEDFFEALLIRFSNIHHQRILWNLDVLIDNCVDLKKDYVDFNPKIHAGFAALELLEKVKDLLPAEDKKEALDILKTSKRKTLLSKKKQA